MSSQGATGAAGYAYPLLRDAQDWTRRLKEQRLYTSYNAPGGDNNTDMSPPWMKFGNDIRLTFNQGRFSCAGMDGCTGNAFSGVIPFTGGGGGGGDYTSFLNYTMYDGSATPGTDPILSDPATWGVPDSSRILSLLTSDAGDDMGGDCRRTNPATIIPRKVDSLYDYCSLHMTGFYTAPVSGEYSFLVQSDDGITIKLNNTLIMDRSGYGNSGGSTSPITLVGGTKYPLEMLWSNGSGGLNLCVTQILVDSSDVSGTYPFTASCSPA